MHGVNAMGMLGLTLGIIGDHLAGANFIRSQLDHAVSVILTRTFGPVSQLISID